MALSWEPAQLFCVYRTHNTMSLSLSWGRVLATDLNKDLAARPVCVILLELLLFRFMPHVDHVSCSLLISQKPVRGSPHTDRNDDDDEQDFIHHRLFGNWGSDVWFSGCSILYTVAELEFTWDVPQKCFEKKCSLEFKSIVWVSMLLIILMLCHWFFLRP